MWKKLLVIACLIAICYCQLNNNNNNNVIRRRICKKKHHHHDPFYHLLKHGGYFVAFILIKLKVIFVLGTIFTIFVAGGKIFGLIKYLELSKTKDHHKPEKIYIQAPSHDHHHDSIPYSAPPPSDFHHSGSGPSFPPSDLHHSGSGPSFPPGFAVDKLPPNAEVAGGGGGNGYFPPPSGYGRSADREDGIYDKFNEFVAMLPKMNLTDIAFNRMKIKSAECRKRYVCKLEFEAKKSFILRTGLEFLSDESYNSYKPNKQAEKLEDCDQFYPTCTNEVK